VLQTASIYLDMLLILTLEARMSTRCFFDKVKNSSLVFDQLINEFDYSWVHVSLNKADNRQMVINEK